MKNKNAKKKQGKCFKNLLKNNIVSVIVMVLLISVVGVFAGNVYVTDGDVDIDEDLNVSSVLFVNSSSGNVGIGTDSPIDSLSIISSALNFGVFKYSNDAASANLNYRKSRGTEASPVNVNDGDYLLNLRSYGYSGGDFNLVGGMRILIDGTGGGGSNPIGGAIIFQTKNEDNSGVSERLRIDKDGNVGIGTTTPSYPLEVNGDVSGISLYTSADISATGYITRTSVYDKSQGNALDFIFDADDYINNGEINHKKFYGYAGEFEVTDYSRAEIEEQGCEDGEGICERIIYPYTKTEEGVSLDSEIDVLRQAVYELKTELCTYNDKYSWC